MNFPKSLNECYNDSNLLNDLEIKIKCNKLVNTIFYGNSASCKSTLVKMILQERIKEFGINNSYHIIYNYILENIITLKNNKLIPTDIEIKIDDMINSFVKQPIIGKNEHNLEKIIVIDDFDTATSVNQQKIINIIDNNPNIIFFIICENIDKLEKTFISRLSLCYLRPLNYYDYLNYLEKIMKINIENIDKHVLKQIFIISKGHINNIMNYLNILLKKSENITYELFQDTFELPNIIMIKSFVKEIIEKKKLDDKIMKMINYFIDNAYSCIDTLEYCWQIIMHLNTKKYKITEFKKIQLMEIISKAVVNMYNNIESWILFNLTIQRIINILNEDE